MSNKISKAKINAIDSMFMEFTSSEKFYAKQVVIINGSVLCLIEEVKYESARKNVYKAFYDLSKEKLKPGKSITIEPKDMDVKLDTSLFGSVIGVDGAAKEAYKGTPIAKDKEVFKQKSFIFGESHKISVRRDVEKTLDTGIVTVDVFNPLSKGQKLAIVGTAKTGKSHLASSMFINPAKKDKEMYLIYAFVGETFETVSQIRSYLSKNRVLKRSLLIHANPASKIEQYLAPFYAMAYAENLRKAGKDVMVVLDNLTTHAHIYSEMSILSNKPVGRDVMPGDIFFQHSSMIERGGNFDNGASITVLPIVSVDQENFASVVASNIISITDGQLLLSASKAVQKDYPAINLGQSVSRIGYKTAPQPFVDVASKIAKFYVEYLTIKDIYGEAKVIFDENIKTVLAKGAGLENLLVFTLKNKSTFSQNLEMFFLKFIEWGWHDVFDKQHNMLISTFVWLATHDKIVMRQLSSASRDNVNWKPLKRYIENVFISISRYAAENINYKETNWAEKDFNDFSQKLDTDQLEKIMSWLRKYRDQSNEEVNYDF